MATDAQKALEQIHKEFTECTLCTEVYVKPKMLPCLHTFCLPCLERFGQNKRCGDLMQCPLCRKDFVIPSGRFASFPNNIYISRLVELRQTSVQKVSSNLCKICAERQSEGAASIPMAEKFCIECQKPLCRDCVNAHKLKVTFSNHTFRLLESYSGSVETDVINTESTPLFCRYHSKDIVNVYCKECSVLVCVKCFCREHNTHKCADVEEVAVNCRAEIDKELETLKESSIKFKEVLALQDVEMECFIKSVNDAKKLIASRAAELTKLVNDHKSKLLLELETVKNNSLSQMHEGKAVTDAGIEAINSLVNFADKVKESGTHVDMINFLGQFKAKKQELEAMPNKDMLCRVKLSFVATDNSQIAANCPDSWIGKLDVNNGIGGDLKIAGKENMPSNAKPAHEVENNILVDTVTNSHGAGRGEGIVRSPCVSGQRCTRCGSLNHLEAACPVSSSVKCYICHVTGHIHAICPFTAYDDDSDSDRESCCTNCNTMHHPSENCRESSNEENCSRCGRSNHTVDGCHVSSSIVCYKCRETGHMQAVCPNSSTADEEIMCCRCDTMHRLSGSCCESTQSSDEENCTRCGNDHDVANCSYPDTIRCFKCMQIGHHIRICSQ